ncbi:MAG TPA: sugar nucleotide-binding protein [Candidatus Kapabacteria bacterium]|nr:sugar nucleotide-binding protein [Candidatus Kapabacteria bacterium]
MTKVLLIGRGQVGSELAQRLRDVELHWWDARIEDVSGEVLAAIKPDVVINAAGKTDLRWCEENARDAFSANVEAPVELFKRMLESDPRCRYIHLSSGCIWDGPFDDAGKPFEPLAAPSPASYYAWTKAACDALLLSIASDRVAILRPRQVYSSTYSPRNTLIKLLRYPQLIDTPNSMSSADVIAKTVQHLLTASDWSGVYNVYDLGHTTPFEIGMMLYQAGLRDQPARIEKSELDTWHRPRRVDTVIHDERFEAMIKPRDVHELLRESIAELAKTHAVAQ